MEFGLYFRMGMSHIADLAGYDHILFLLALCAGYAPSQWRRIAWLVTAFTLGHATTLALTAWDLIPTNRPLVEVLIAATIVLTALYNLAQAWLQRDLSQLRTSPSAPRYLVAMLFGLVHGLGFSGLLRAMTGHSDAVLVPLLGFNLGIETGQLGIVLVLVAMQAVLLRISGWRLRVWTTAASVLALILATDMLAERIPAL